jgi:exodeoxyribonuclease V alpha subunit
MSESRGFETGQLSPLGTVRRRLDGAAAAPYPLHLLPELRDADLGPESLFLAWELTALAGALSASERGQLIAVLVRVLIRVAAGSTRAEVSGADRALLARAPEVVGAPGDRRPMILDGRWLYPQRLLACEDRLATLLRARRAGPAPAEAAPIEQALSAVAQDAQPRPTDEQLAAVRAALGGRLTVISGGPGTGKTTIALAIVRALARLGVPAGAVALAAPTGKAANRLEEAIRHGLARLPSPSAPADAELARAAPAAQTLHRLLGWSPRRGSFAHHQNNRLAHQAVIVDESSMIDLALMERLVRSVADDARLVLLGDADQLPSIEAGAVFRDLAPLAHRLARSHRVDPGAAAGRDLAAFARGVREGAPPLITPVPAAALRFEGVELVLPDQRESLLERWYQRVLVADEVRAAAARRSYRAGADGQFSIEDQAGLGKLHADLHRARVLCVTRGRPTGTWAVNQWLHRRHGAARAPFAPGEPVMVLRNDYQRGLYNGDQGVVIWLDEDQDDPRPARLAAAFPTRLGWQAFPLDGIGDALELSFAMTVHKSQGSELDLALLLLPDVPIPILTRELLYTAVTRVRHAVVIGGAPAVLSAGAGAPLVRSSGLADKLGL